MPVARSDQQSMLAEGYRTVIGILRSMQNAQGSDVTAL